MHISASVAARTESRRYPLRRDSAPPPVVSRPAKAPPFKLRFVLLVLLGTLSAWSLYPRMQAAFRLHDAAVATADYGLCMVGPTGPNLIRDRKSDFDRLVRRRLIASAPGDRPFHRCDKLARRVTDSVDVERVHNLTAAEFRDYSGRGVSLAELGVSAAPLSQLCADAWPFARGGYTQLMKPSLGAVEAAHVPAPPRPVLGRGLPARSGIYRNVWRDGNAYGLALGAGSDTALLSTPDRGLTFRPLASRADLIEQHAERCASSDGRRVYRLTPREDGAFEQVLFSLEGAAPMTTDLMPQTERVLGTACDERSLAVLSFDQKRNHLRICAFATRCSEVTLPELVAVGSAADVAKVKGIIVVSTAQDGVMRVMSSRDEGRTFTPAVVAFDAAEYPELGLARRVPQRLLGLGERLLLVGSPTRGNDSYPLLVSDDQGVSFRAP